MVYGKHVLNQSCKKIFFSAYISLQKCTLVNDFYKNAINLFVNKIVHLF